MVTPNKDKSVVDFFRDYWNNSYVKYKKDFTLAEEKYKSLHNQYANTPWSWKLFWRSDRNKTYVYNFIMTSTLIGSMSGGALGSLWGILQGKFHADRALSDAILSSNTVLGARIYQIVITKTILAEMIKNAAKLGLFVGLYTSSELVIASYRRRYDVFNSIAAGGIAGGVAGTFYGRQAFLMATSFGLGLGGVFGFFETYYNRIYNTEALFPESINDEYKISDEEIQAIRQQLRAELEERKKLIEDDLNL